MSEDSYGGGYDPTAPEGDNYGRSQYVTKRDVRVIAVLILVLAIAAYPVYKMLERNAHRSVCRSNLGAIADAINQYASLHDDRFPPIMRTNANGSPNLGDSGHPYTWASDLQDFMNRRASFECPEAAQEEVTKIEGHEKVLPLTYGMYEPYGGFLRTVVPNPDQTVLVVETSNHGSKTSFDPLPYKDLSGNEVPWDGFVVGWQNSNDRPNEQSDRITRLAFPGTSSGNFVKDGETRHDGGILAINCSGAILPLLKQTDGKVNIKSGLPSGFWEAPATSAHSK